MNKYTLILSAIALAMCLVSCSKDNEAQDEFIKACPELGISVGGKLVSSFSESSSQFGCCEERGQLRVSDDNMTSFYVLKAGRMPGGVGSSLKGDLTWTTDVDVRKRSGLEFKVIRIEQDYYWLWNKKFDIGIVVKYIR